MNYNQKLAQYNVGKDAVSSGKTAYNEGKAQLDAGWDAYNEGSEQLKNYDKAKAQYDESLAAYNKLTKAISDLEAKSVNTSTIKTGQNPPAMRPCRRSR